MTERPGPERGADRWAPVGSDDPLDGSVPDDPTDEPAARTRFRRPADVVAATLIAVAALVGTLLIWQSSDIRATTSEPATGADANQQVPPVPESLPPSLGESWRADSPATPDPVAVGPTVVTGDGGEVAGRDPLSGRVRWRYARDLPLCTVSSAFSMVLAVHQKSDNLLPESDPRKQGGCGEMTALDPATGNRGKPLTPGAEPDSGQRNSDAELGTRLVDGGRHVTTTGSRLLTTIRSDLVQTMEYGEVPAITNPNKQPRTGCVFGSVTALADRIGLIERCPGDPGDRFTVYEATGPDNSADEPQVVSSVILGGDGARVVAMSDRCQLGSGDPEPGRAGDQDMPGADGTEPCSAVAVPDPDRLVILNEQGNQVTEYPLDLGRDDLRGDPDGLVVPTTTTSDAIYWHTGSRTIALSTAALSPLWTVEGALGPGTEFVGHMLVPVRDGIVVLNQATGVAVGTLPVDRQGYSGPVTMATIGPMVLEQRGSTLVALR